MSELGRTAVTHPGTAKKNLDTENLLHHTYYGNRDLLRVVVYRLWSKRFLGSRSLHWWTTSYKWASAHFWLIFSWYSLEPAPVIISERCSPGSNAHYEFLRRRFGRLRKRKVNVGIEPTCLEWNNGTQNQVRGRISERIENISKSRLQIWIRSFKLKVANSIDGRTDMTDNNVFLSSHMQLCKNA